MSDIKAGEVAFIKTTGEAVFVLAVTDRPHKVYTGYTDGTKKDPPQPLSENLGFDTVVRRANISQNGTYHGPEHFSDQELETLDNQRARFIQERQEMLAKYAPSNQQPEAPPDHGFSLN